MRSVILEFCGHSDNVRSAMQDMIASRPDLIVLDLALLGASGYKFLAQLKELKREIKVVVFSAYAEMRL